MYEIKFSAKHAISIFVGIILLVASVLVTFQLALINARWFWPTLVVSIVIIFLPFLLDFLAENKRQKEIETKFLEFVRNLVETVGSGIPIPQAVKHVAEEDYGALSPYIKKLANQLEWGIPVHEALKRFSYDTKNAVIKRSMAIVIQAEESGGDMGDVLQSVSNSVIEVKQLKEEMKASSYSQTMQGYVVFFVFLGIMLLLEVKLLPKIADMAVDIGTGLSGAGGVLSVAGAAAAKSNLNFSMIFTALILIQGLFAGLMIGKFSEGHFKDGIKHAVILVITSALIMLTFAPPTF